MPALSTFFGYALKPDSRDKDLAAKLEDAVFSRDESNAIPVVLQTGYSKPHDAEVVKVLLTAKIDLTSLLPGKPSAKGRNAVDAVVALFGSDGAYVTQSTETALMSLHDTSEEDRAITLHWELPGIGPGSYVVRLVVLDPQSKALTMMNRTLQVF